MITGIFQVPNPRNEPVLVYAPGSPERRALRLQLGRMAGEVIEITARIAGRKVATGNTAEAVMPHDHHHGLAIWHKAGTKEVAAAIDAALTARQTWSRMAWHDRAAIFLKAAELLAGPYRMVLNAATMLGQSKTVHQAEMGTAAPDESNTVVRVLLRIRETRRLRGRNFGDPATAIPLWIDFAVHDGPAREVREGVPPHGRPHPRWAARALPL